MRRRQARVQVATQTFDAGLAFAATAFVSLALLAGLLAG